MAFYWQIKTSEAPRHPSLSWANWKNDSFKAWDRDEQVEKEITLPKEFVVIADSWSIKGYLADKGWVWSNEIYSFSDDVFFVRDNTWTILFEWLWNDIKEKVKAVGLKLTKNIHYIDPKEPNDIRTFCIKWAWLKAWMDSFSNENRNIPWYKRLKLKEVANWKTWAVKYTYPVFEWASDLTADDRMAQQTLWDVLMNYKEATTMSAKEFEETKAVKESDDIELPF